MAKTYEIEVAGTGMFPYDMLRYDRARFKTLDDEQTAAGRGKRRVKLICQDRPTSARWESFLWRVVEEG